MRPKKISENYPVLSDETSLVIVTGKQTAKVYELKNGKILKQPTVNIENPWKTDNEGFRQRNGRGTVWGTPSDYEQKNNGVKHDFLVALKSEIKTLIASDDFDHIYLFAPQTIFSEVKGTIPKTSQKKIAVEYKGIFTKSSPTDLLKKIKTKKDNRLKAREKVKPEAKKLLNKPKQRNGRH